MKLQFHFDPAKCSACGACSIACMDQNDIAISEGQTSYRRVYSLEEEGALLSLSIACLHCTDPPCVSACPMGCLSKEEETGLTVVDNRRCIGCRACAQACPYDAPTFRPTGEFRPKEKMEKCHGCLERVRAGKAPACVHACPTGALTWTWVENSNGQAPLGNLYRQWMGEHSNRSLENIDHTEEIIMENVKNCIATDKAPAAIGPYSQAVSANGLVFLSGQLALDPATGTLVEGGIQAQTEQAFRNIEAILEKAGLTTAHVIKTTVFLSDINDFAAMNEVYAKHFSGSYPARSAVQVAALPKGGLVEIECIAAKGE